MSTVQLPKEASWTVETPLAETAPGRVLIISASIGEGHNAAGKALAEAVGKLWPEARVRWVDVLDEMGYGSGPLFRGAYTNGLRSTPWLYEFFYTQVRRRRWLARASKRMIGAWSGRKLAAVIDSAAPDMMISTYPMATTGLEWLRRHRGLAIPTGTWVAAFDPHPSWVHAGVDLNLVMHDVAVAPARDGVPEATVTVAALPVPEAFQPGDRAAARREWDLPTGRFVAVVSCGSLAFGSAEDTVRELLDGGGDIEVVVVAGRNESLAGSLSATFRDERRVRVLGWVEDMPSLLRAADIVVTNAGGATFREAMACGRAVLMHNPIAGHGRANARLMAEAGLAQVCDGTGTLAAAVRELRDDPNLLAGSEREIARHLGSHQLADGLRDLWARAAPTPARPLRAEDALFVHVQTQEVPQQVGTVLVFEPSGDGHAPSRAHAAEMLAGVPGVTGYLLPATNLRRARWCPNQSVTAESLVDEVHLAGGSGPAELDAAIDEFFSEPLDATHACGQARLVTGLDGGGRAILVKLHHAVGDGITVLRGLLSGTDGSGRSWASAPKPPIDNGFRARPKRPLGALWGMLRAGTAPPAATTGPISGPARHHERLLLPIDQVKRTASSLKVTTSELLQTVFAEAVYRTFEAAAADSRGRCRRKPRMLRLMAPWSLRGTNSLRAAGNSAGALSADLPIGPMPLAERVQRVATIVRRCAAGGLPELAGAIVHSLGYLPPPLHRFASRLVYRSRWFNVIGTVLPGPRWTVRVRGAELNAAYPVLPLAPGVGLTWGAMTWGEWVTFCLTVTGPHASDGRALARAAQQAFDELTELGQR